MLTEVKCLYTYLLKYWDGQVSQYYNSKVYLFECYVFMYLADHFKILLHLQGHG